MLRKSELTVGIYSSTLMINTHFHEKKQPELGNELTYAGGITIVSIHHGTIEKKAENH